MVKKDHVIKRQGREMILYEGLLSACHEKGLKRIITRVVQIPAPENGNMAVVHATVEVTLGSFDGTGDATPENVSPMVAPHILRMAETRAKARAMRDAVNASGLLADDIDHYLHQGQEAPRERQKAEREPLATPEELATIEQRCADAGRELHQKAYLTQKEVPIILDALSRDRVHRRLSAPGVSHPAAPPDAAAAAPESETDKSPDGATPEQMQRIRKLLDQLVADGDDLDDEIEETLTRGEAAKRITELARRFNERTKKQDARS